MRISKKAQHAVRAVLDLTLHGRVDRELRSAEVARRSGVPEKFLEAIFRDLRQAGLVASKRGPIGGHRLAVDPRRLTVSAVVEAIDGPLFEQPTSARAVHSAADTSVRSLWKRVEVAVAAVLENVTLEELRRESAAPGPLDYNI
jgi:Rrf2 family protein